MESLERIYTSHHKTKRGENFVLLGKERGEFLRNSIGTGKRVLDIGCRDGALTSLYAEGNIIVGMDIDAESLQRAKESLAIETIHQNIYEDWTIPPNSFDVVVAAEVLEHLYYPDVVIKKIVLALKKDGVFVGSVPNAFSLKNRVRYAFLRKKGTPMEDPTHINHFTVSELKKILLSHFKQVRITGTGRYVILSELFPQLFAFDLLFEARDPRES